jgi:tetratricopeptide (TPR) repeat protein
MILRDNIFNKVSSDENKEAHKKIKILLSYDSESKNQFQRGEIWLDSGMAIYKMGDLFKAIVHFEKAVNHFPPVSHEHAITLWILGSVQWEIGKNEDASRNWEKAIDEFRTLERISEENRRMNEVNWYKRKKRDLENSIEQKLA